MTRRILPLLLILLGAVGCAKNSTHVQGVTVQLDDTPVTHEGALMAQDEAMELDEAFLDDFDDDAFAEFEEEFTADEARSYDPIESWNRGVFRFNDKTYTWVLRPFTRAYRTITPEPIRQGTRNFFHNLAMPVRAVNCLLQGKFGPAGLEVARFSVNSVVGVFGCADAAADVFGWERQNEDFGQTLGAWGITEGPYLVWPLMGPSNLRDSTGRVGDYFFQPLSYVDAFEVELILKGFEYSNLASFSLEDYDLLQEEALEPYVALREGYLQYRRREIQE